MIVAKFGGSSLADAHQFQKVRAIIQSDSERKYVVPSAPGKRSKEDEKITDLLYACQRAAEQKEDVEPLLSAVRLRYQEIADALGLRLALEKEFREIKAALLSGASPAYAASRGEYLNGKLLSEYLGFSFVDAKELFLFDRNGQLMEEETNRRILRALENVPQAVIPGFYGADTDGHIRTFSRGGSDVSAAVIARALNADVYENWTDVTGVRMADPRIVPDSQWISTMTYRELRELSYMGFTVLHDEAVFPVRQAGIPTNIRNTNDPLHPGTMICAAAPIEPGHLVTGIAGLKGFTAVAIEKNRMNAEPGFVRRVLQAFEEYGVSIENVPTGIDTMCVVVEEKALLPHRDEILHRIEELAHPDQLTLHSGLALIATVGRGMVQNYGIAARLFTALSNHGISVRTIDQGSSEMNIIIGVDEKQFENAVDAIYDAFIRD